MEDVMVRYDGTVRNSLGDVVQFVYGEDGMDATFIEKQYLPGICALPLCVCGAPLLIPLHSHE